MRKWAKNYFSINIYHWNFYAFLLIPSIFFLPNKNPSTSSQVKVLSFKCIPKRSCESLTKSKNLLHEAVASISLCVQYRRFLVMINMFFGVLKIVFISKYLFFEILRNFIFATHGTYIYKYFHKFSFLSNKLNIFS